MALTRRMLKELGLEGEVIDKIMDAHGSTIAEMTTKAEAEENSKKAVAEAVVKAKEEWEKTKPEPTKVKESEEYKALEKEYNDFKFDTQLTGAKVKDKYKDFVKSKMDMTKPFDEAIKGIQEEYGEFFETEKTEEDDDQKGNPAFVNGGENDRSKKLTPEQEEVEKMKKLMFR